LDPSFLPSIQKLWSLAMALQLTQALPGRRGVGARALGRAARAFATSEVHTHGGTQNVWYTAEHTSSHLRQKTVSLIGAKLGIGQSYGTGVNEAPQALRAGGLRAVVEELGWKIHDVGDLDLEGAIENFTGPSSMRNVNNCEKIGMANRLVHEAVREEAKKGNFVLNIGGDHSLGSATISGMKAVHDDLAVLWVDAHADCNTAATSPSGNYHGMSAAHVLNWIQPPLPGWEWLRPELMMRESRFAFVALRDVDQHERRMLRESGVTVFTMHEIDRWGIGMVMEMAMHSINPHSNRPVHLEFDIDSCDPSIAPGTGTCSRGGLNFREAHYICEKLAMTNNLVSLSMVEVNPQMDEPTVGRMHGDNDLITAQTQTVRLSIELIASALGRTIL